jgi:hypothetical protein
MYTPPTPPPVDYICKCGSRLVVEREHGWIYVTCNNPKCKDHGIRQLATWGKHTVKEVAE